MIQYLFFHRLSGEQKQWLATSQINLGEIRLNENVTVKVYGDRNFLCNIYRVQAMSQDDGITVVSHVMPTPDSDHLEVVLAANGNKLNHLQLVRGSFTLFSHNNNEATVRISGIIVSE